MRICIRCKQFIRRRCIDEHSIRSQPEFPAVQLLQRLKNSGRKIDATADRFYKSHIGIMLAQAFCCVQQLGKATAPVL